MKERKQIRRNLTGVLFAVKVGGHHGHGSALGLLTAALEGYRFEGGKGLGPARSEALARYLLDELDIGYSATAMAGVEGNDAIRPANQVGISPTRELERMLDAATKKVPTSKAQAGVVGRQRGLAQALSFIRQPFSVIQEGSGYHAKKIKEELRASERRVASD